MKIYAPGTALENGTMYIENSVFYLSNSTTGDDITAKILTNGSIIVTSDSDTVAGIGKNYFSTKAFSSTYTVSWPWSITSGFLKYNGKNFHAVPSGIDNGTYVLGSSDAAAGRDTVIIVSILAIGDDDQSVDNFVPDVNGTSSSPSSSSSSSRVASSSAVGSSSAASSSSSSTNGAAALIQGGILGSIVMGLMMLW